MQNAAVSQPRCRGICAPVVDSVGGGTLSSEFSRLSLLY